MNEANGRRKQVSAVGESKAGLTGQQTLGEWLDELLFGEVTARGPLDGPCIVSPDKDLEDADEVQL
jgi:hypothetical protein